MVVHDPLAFVRCEPLGYSLDQQLHIMAQDWWKYLGKNSKILFLDTRILFLEEIQALLVNVEQLITGGKGKREDVYS